MDQRLKGILAELNATALKNSDECHSIARVAHDSSQSLAHGVEQTLPLAVPDIAINHVAEREYLVDNRELQARTTGLSFRFHKHLSNDQAGTVTWGSTVRASTEHGALVLPLIIFDKPVLVERGEPGTSRRSTSSSSSSAPRERPAPA